MLVNEDYTTKARTASKTKWIFPGGKHDSGETHLDAAKRELFEETGVGGNWHQGELAATELPGA
jgi:8-oxo-dGTP pyrophosphatase MutT (NUDIX family)